MHPQKKRTTSWEPVGKWYQSSVGEDGHYYHQQIVIPGVLKLLELNVKTSSVLDIACGQGVLARHLPEQIPYTGVDISESLIKEAKRQDRHPDHRYLVADATKPLKLEKTFSHAAIILALQNMEFPDQALQQAAKWVESNGKLVIVLNHPCFRIPRQSSWGVDQGKKLQYRRMDAYASSLQIPIQAHPSKGEKSPMTWSFHHPLSAYSRWLSDSGFYISQLEEWCSDKVSTGGAAKMENRSRQEFPLFLAIQATKK